MTRTIDATEAESAPPLSGSKKPISLFIQKKREKKEIKKKM
jgi:hypothetical protein